MVHNHPNYFQADAVTLGKLRLRNGSGGVFGADSSNIGLGELCVSVPLTPWKRGWMCLAVMVNAILWWFHKSVSKGVLHVLKPRTPFQFCIPIVSRVSVLVVYFVQLARLRTEKSGGNDLVNSKSPSLFVFEKSQPQVSVCLSRRENVSTPSNSTKIGDIVNPLVTDNRTPYFMHVLSMAIHTT